MPDRLAACLDGQRMALASWLVTPGGFMAENVGRLGLDCVVVDLQHGAIGWADLLQTLQGLELAGAQALVRIPSDTPSEIMKALDLGASGLVIPMVSTADQAKAIVSAMRYAPSGTRSFGPTRAMKDAYRPEKGGQRWCIPMIETRTGLSNSRDIAMTDGVDGLLVGTGDLTLDMGFPLGANPTPEVVDAMRFIAKNCRESGKFFAVTWFTPIHSETFLGLDLQLFIYGSDVTHLATGVADALKMIKEKQACA